MKTLELTMPRILQAPVNPPIDQGTQDAFNFGFDLYRNSLHEAIKSGDKALGTNSAKVFGDYGDRIAVGLR
jgi:hypothetical protein